MNKWEQCALHVCQVVSSHLRVIVARGRGKAKRANGRAGSETSGETEGKWMMINTCV